MLTETGDFTIDYNGHEATLRGVLRLPSPTSYDAPFDVLHQAVTSTDDPFVVDISDVRFMNSSGITAMSRLVLLARSEHKSLVLRGAKSVAWQRKTLRSLGRLYDGLRIELA